MSAIMEPTIIDTTAALAKLLNDLGESHGPPPILYMDLEGDNLSRHGTLSLITILLEPEKQVYLIDVTTLGRVAFTTSTSEGRTLKSILESSDIVKVFFDIRNDSDALFGLYGVRVAGIEDLQLMELASRNFSKRCVNGLAKCIDGDYTIGHAEKRQWQIVKDKGRQLFDPSRGGSYNVFDQRPLSEDMKRYCAQDVSFMPQLRQAYRKKLCDAWWLKIEAETTERIRLSQSPGYNGKGRHMALGPIGWLSWNSSPSERNVRTLLQDNPARGTARETSTLPKDLIPDAARRTEIDEVAEPGGSWTAAAHDVGGESHAFGAHTMLADALRRSVLDVDDEEDFEEEEQQYFGGGYDDYDGPSFDSDRGGDDFTACSKDDCGYCGRCMY